MTRSSHRNRSSQVTLRRDRSGQYGDPSIPTDALRQGAAYAGMKLIPWGDVWKSLRTARFRGNGEMIEVFYDTLFKEAVFDDNGAWSPETRRLH